VGNHEISEMLGSVSRQRVYQITRRADFPQPVARLAQGKVWLGDQVEAWIAARRGKRADPQPGPDPATTDPRTAPDTATTDLPAGPDPGSSDLPAGPDPVPTGSPVGPDPAPASEPPGPGRTP